MLTAIAGAVMEALAAVVFLLAGGVVERVEAVGSQGGKLALDAMELVMERSGL